MADSRLRFASIEGTRSTAGTHRIGGAEAGATRSSTLSGSGYKIGARDPVFREGCMPPAVAWSIGLGVVALVVALIVRERRLERARGEALVQAAAELGMTFEPDVPVDALVSLGDSPLYSRGRARRAKNVMGGRRGDDTVRLLDYQYTVGSGKHQHTWRQSVAVFPGVAHSLPDFELTPETAFHKIGQAFGARDIDFEANPEFSAKYVLRGGDETAIRAAFRDDILAFFATHQGWTLEVSSGTVVAYRAGKRARAEELRAFLEEAHETVRTLRGA